MVYDGKIFLRVVEKNVTIFIIDQNNIIEILFLNLECQCLRKAYLIEK